MYASRLWWLLRYAGHRAVAVLDGGFARWTAEGRPVRPGLDVRPRAVFRPSFNREMHVTADDVERRRHDGRTVLVDARAAERFEGRSETIDRIAGHIPGAHNRFFKDNLAADGTMLGPEALRAAFSQVLDGRAAADAVMYCGSGVTACHNLLAMSHAGLDGSALYTGSWSEWSSDPSRPVETGPARADAEAGLTASAKATASLAEAERRRKPRGHVECPSSPRRRNRRSGPPSRKPSAAATRISPRVPSAAPSCCWPSRWSSRC